MATADNGDRQREIVGAALDVASAEGRLGYLQGGACGEEAALLARVQDLLRAHEAPNVKACFTLELTALIEGPTSASVWEFGDGVVVVSNRPYATHAWMAPGDYRRGHTGGWT